MIEFEKIKLVIWDLDETFWQGTLSEEGVIVSEENINLIKNLTDCGIINAICSKNDFAPVEAKFKELGIWEFFVFNSINWESKGNRIKQLIKDMQLRPANVLFIDDNHSNREEAKYFCPEIMTEGPEIISKLIDFVNSSPKKDPEHKRLNQYKVLEEKREEKQNYSSNEEFLKESNIRLNIKYDCENQIERIHDLVLRSNQLNFTKDRSSIEKLKEIINTSNIETAYVEVSDKFGDYGIVGFYALKDNELIHFVFSCRTLGMGIEQYVYNFIKRPKLTVVGEVISDLSSKDIPNWINQEQANKKADKFEVKNLKEHMVLIKGPCDLYQIYPYVSNTELFDTEFTHTMDNGVVVETTGHTTHIVESKRLSSAQKEIVCEELPFIFMDCYNDNIFKNDYKVVVLSILQDANMGVYERKETGERFAFLEYILDLTDPNNWQDIIDGKHKTANYNFTHEDLEFLSKNYRFLGRNDENQILENIKYIRSNLKDDCVLVIMLGGELYYEKNTFEAYKDRHIFHKKINDKLREYAESQPNIKLLDVNKYIKDQNSFYDHFNHYIKPVYYKLAEEMIEIINESIGSCIKETSKLTMVKIKLKETFAPLYYKLRKFIGR